MINLSILRDINIFSVALRMLMAAVCGAIAGLEREKKHKAAGLKTHMLICLGACIPTLTSQYMIQILHVTTDVARLGAQVIAGIGFIGAGVIMVTRKRQVRGLTTAAGLWVAAIIGLSCGCGFYELALMATLMVIIIELMGSKWEPRIFKGDNIITVLHVEYDELLNLNEILTYLGGTDTKINGLHMPKGGKNGYSANITIQRPRKLPVEELCKDISRFHGIHSIKELKPSAPAFTDKPKKK